MNDIAGILSGMVPEGPPQSTASSLVPSPGALVPSPLAQAPPHTVMPIAHLEPSLPKHTDSVEGLMAGAPGGSRPGNLSDILSSFAAKSDANSGTDIVSSADNADEQ